MRRLRWFLAALIPAALFLSGCIQTGYDKFKENCPEDWTARQVEAAYDLFLKEFFMKKQEDGTYAIDHSAVSVADARAVVQGVLGDLDYVLSSENWRTLLLAMPTVRAGFEKEERRWQYIETQLGQAEVYFDFLEMIGKAVTDEDREYSIQYLLPDQNFDYTVDYLEAARQAGTLQEVERVVSYLYTPFGEKEPDPAAPDDPAAFVWVPKLKAFVIVSYAILNSEKPRELKADYVEVWRADFDGDRIQTETQPCARAFRKLAGRTLQVFLLDYDWPGEPGYGVPDEVKPIYATTGSDLYEKFGEYFDGLATCRSEEVGRQRTYELPELDVQIVRSGQVGEWRGDYNAAGWQVPYVYRDKEERDFTTKLTKEEEDGYVHIKYVIRVWSDGAVWEYWTPAEVCAGELEQAFASGRSVTYQPIDGVRVTISTSQVLGQLYAIIYKDGDEWVKIYDADGTGILQYMIRGVPEPTVNSAAPGSPFSHNI